MDKYTWRQIEAMLKEGSHKRVKRRIMSALAMVVSFVTVAMLVLPAVAMVGDPVYYCGMEEHVHTDECLGAIPVHKHTAECYDADGTLVCEEIGAAGYGYERVDVYHKLVCGYSGTKVDLKNAADVKNASASNWENKAKEPADLTGKGPAVPSVSETEVAPAENESASAPAEEEVLPEEKNDETTADESTGTTEEDETAETVETAEAGETVQESTEAETHEEIRETEESTEEAAEEPEEGEAAEDEAENEEENLDEAENEADADTVALSVPSIIRHIVAAVASNAENDLTDPSEAGAQENLTNEEENDEPEEPEANVTGDENEDDDDDSENPADAQEADQVKQPAADVTDAPADENVSDPTDETEEGNNSATEATRPTLAQPAEDETGNTEGTIPETETQATVPTTGSSQTVENATETRPASDSNWDLEEGESYIPQEGDWILICGLEEGANHHHTEDCYLPFDPADYEPNELYDEIIWNQTQFYDDAIYDEDLFFNPDMYLEDEEADRVHVHTPDCFASYEIVYICGKKEHTHTEECRKPRLREGQWEQIQEVERMIEALPDIIDIEEVVTEEEVPEEEIAEEEILADEGLEEENTLEEDIPLEEDAAPQAAPFSINKIGAGLAAGLKKIANVPTDEAIEDSEEEEQQERQTTYVVPEFSEEDLLQNQEVLLNAQESIEAAQEKYDALDNEAKAYVSAKNRIKLAYLEEMSYGIMTIAERTGATDNLGDYITGLTITTEDGKPLEPDDSGIYHVANGQQVKFGFDFAEDESSATVGQFKLNENHQMIYNLPEGFDWKSTEGEEWFEEVEVDGEKKRIGKYTIRNNQLIFEFTPINGGKYDGKYYPEVFGNTKIHVNIDATAHTTGKKQEVKVPLYDESEILINVEGNPVILAQKKGTYNPTEEKVNYSVSVNAVGDVQDLVIEDKFGSGDSEVMDYCEPKDFVVKLDGEVLTLNTDYRIEINEADPKSKSFRIIYLKDNGVLKNGKTLTVDYYAKVLSDKIPADRVGDNAKTIDNEVTAKGNDATPGTAKDDVKLTKDILKKSGTLETIVDEYNVEHKVIKWEVKVGDGTGELVRDGHHIEIDDTLVTSDHLSYYTGKDIVVKVYDKDGNKVGELTYKWDGDKLTPGDSRLQGGTFDGDSFQMKLPDLSDLKRLYGTEYSDEQYKNFRFKVEYYTEYTMPPQVEEHYATFENRVSSAVNVYTSGTVYVEYGTIEKNVNRITNSDGKDVLQYTAELKLPSDNYEGYFYIRDELAFKDQDYFAKNVPNIVSITVNDYSDEDSVKYTYKKYNPETYREGDRIYDVVQDPKFTDRTDPQIQRFHIVFNTTDGDYHNSHLLEGDTPSKIVITYEIPVDTPIAPEDTTDFSEGLTIKDYLDRGYTLNNWIRAYTDGYAHYTDGEVDYSEELVKGKHLVKNGKALRGEDGSYNGEFTYEVIFKDWRETGILEAINGGILKYQGKDGLDKNTYSVLFKDTFDPSLEYVPGSLKVEYLDKDGEIRAYYGYARKEEEEETPGEYAEERNFTDKLEITKDGPVINGSSIEVDLRDLVLLVDPKGTSTTDWFKSDADHYGSLSFAMWYRSKEDLDRNDCIVIKYRLKFRDGFNPASKAGDGNEFEFNVENTAGIYGPNETSYGEDTNTIPYPTGLLTKEVHAKTVEPDEDTGESSGSTKPQEMVENVFDFTIKFNPQKQDFVPGSETLTLRDKMSDNLSLDMDSFVVKRLIPESNDAGEITYREEELDKSTWNVIQTNDEGTEFMITGLPDSTYLQITYKARVYQSGNVTISNVASVEGLTNSDVDIEKEFWVTNKKATIDASLKKILLQKVEEGDYTNLLEGAVFRIYIMSDQQPEDLHGNVNKEYIKIITQKDPVPAWPIPREIKEGDYVEDDFKWTTGPDGTVWIETPLLFNGYRYILVEEKAPEGYALLTDPVTFTYGESTDQIGYGEAKVIENKPYVELPETGGTGTIPVTLAGLVMSLGAAYVWYDRRSGEEEEDTDQRDIC